MYGLWWHKSFEVEHVTCLARFNKNAAFQSGRSWKAFPESAGRLFELALGDVWDKNKYSVSIFYLTATAVSALHLVAWSWTSPTPIARNIWRGFGVGATAAALLVFFNFNLPDAS